MSDGLRPFLFPVGAVTYFSGLLSAIPKGWQICDGTNGTPDMHDTFFRGAPAGIDSGGTGGANTVTLDQTMIPSHTHSLSQSNHTHTITGRAVVSGDNAANTKGVNNAAPAITDNLSGVTLNNAGSGNAHNNKPAYVELAHIMRMY